MGTSSQGAAAGGHRRADILARRHKAHVHPAQEQHQAQVSVGKAGYDAQQLSPAEFSGEQLEQGEYQGDGQQSGGNLLKVFGEAVDKIPGGGGGVRHLRNGGQLLLRLVRLIDDAQQQNGQDGPDGAQGHQTEAVAGGILVAAGGGHAQTQSHDKGHGDGPGGHAAGVEGYGDEVGRGEGRQQEHHPVKQQQQAAQGHPPPHPQGGHHQKQAHSHRHGEDQHHIGDGGDLVGQHRQVGLRHGGQHPKQKVQQNGDQQSFLSAEHRAHPLSHGQHGHVHPKGEEAHADHQQHRPEQEQHQGARLKGGNGDGQQEHNGRDGQDRGHGFLKLF